MTCGDSYEEAEALIQEAVAIHLESLTVARRIRSGADHKNRLQCKLP